MASANVVLNQGSEADSREPAEQIDIYKAKVSKTIKNDKGKDEKHQGTLELPEGKTLEAVLAIHQGSEADVVFWHNLGRRMAAKQQVAGSLNNVFSDPKVEELRKAFENAIEQMLAGSNDPKKRERYETFVMNEDQYAPLREAFEERKRNPEAAIKNFNFAEIELKKPTGKVGAPKKNKDGSDSDESESDE